MSKLIIYLWYLNIVKLWPEWFVKSFFVFAFVKEFDNMSFCKYSRVSDIIWKKLINFFAKISCLWKSQICPIRILSLLLINFSLNVSAYKMYEYHFFALFHDNYRQFCFPVQSIKDYILLRSSDLPMTSRIKLSNDISKSENVFLHRIMDMRKSEDTNHQWDHMNFSRYN